MSEIDFLTMAAILRFLFDFYWHSLLIITDYNKFYFKRLKFTVFQKCEYVYKTACLHKSSYTPAKISREPDRSLNKALIFKPNSDLTRN